MDYIKIEIDLEKEGDDCLAMAQFFFPIEPFSTNKAYIPSLNRKTGHSYLRINDDAERFKNDVIMLANSQTRNKQSRAYGWKAKDRPFSMTVILRSGQKKCERMDVDNAHKLVQDAFVMGGLLPDDKAARDCRQIYADFTKLDMAKDAVFATLIRWGNGCECKGKYE